MIDIYQSRRKYPYRCTYWKRDLNGVMDNNTLIHEKTPDGVFYARIASSKYSDTQDVINVFHVAEQGLTLETQDIVSLEKDDIVLFRGQHWLAGRINNDPVQKNAEFGAKESNITYIELRKGM